MRLKFDKLTLEKWIITLSFTTDMIATLNPKHFIMLSRPKIDVEDIAENVRRNYSEDITKWLFSEELQKKIDQEIEVAKNRAIENNVRLPHPTIFIGQIVETKHKDWKTTLKLRISHQTALYVLDNNSHLHSMVFELWSYPNHLASTITGNSIWTNEEVLKVVEIKDRFLSENPEAKEIEDCFEGMIKFYNDKSRFSTSNYKPYKRPNFKYKDKVLYVE